MSAHAKWRICQHRWFPEDRPRFCLDCRAQLSGDGTVGPPRPVEHRPWLVAQLIEDRSVSYPDHGHRRDGAGVATPPADGVKYTVIDGEFYLLVPNREPVGPIPKHEIEDAMDAHENRGG
jgi:hypothetical protein